MTAAVAVEIPTPEARLAACGVGLSNWEDELADLIEPDGRVVNNGIGPYEYWGFKCRQDIWEFECEDSGEATIEWCQLEPPTLDEMSPYTYTDYVAVAKNQYEDESYEVEVKAQVTSFSAEYTSVRHHGCVVHYWKCKATFSWAAK